MFDYFWHQTLIMKLRIIARKLFKYFLQGLIILAPITITFWAVLPYLTGLTASCRISFTDFFPEWHLMKMVIPDIFRD